VRYEVDNYEARVSIGAIYQVVQSIRKGALTEELIGTAFRIIDKGFDQHMQSVIGARDDLRHMYDWGMVGSNQGKLWKTVMEGRGKSREVMFIYKPSVKKVPHGELEGTLRRRHVFRDKAEVFEEAQPVTISPRFARFLVYINHHAGEGTTTGSGTSFTSGDDEEGQKITFTERTSVIDRAGGGKYYRRFTAEFVAYWTNPGGSVEKLTQSLANDMEMQTAIAASAKNRIANYKNKMQSSDAEAKRRAKKAIQTINAKMKQRGR